MLPGPGCDFDLVFHVVAQGVKALWKRGSVVREDDLRPSPMPSRKLAPRQSALVLRWVGALRARDMDSLKKLTSYPFALHDTGKENRDCDGHRARTSASLAEALLCLTGNEMFFQHLTARATPAVGALDTSDLPQWAKKWRKEILPGLTPVAFSVAGDGVDWDFIALLADDGVRALWKATWFDAN